MSTEEVTVSLSRLALAKAIKTPDAGEDEAEPWTKSIIFHQAHIDEQMRNSILSPHSQQQNRRKNGRHGNQKQPLLKQNRYPPQPQQQQQYHHQGRQVAAPMNRVRSDEMRQATPSPPAQQQNRPSYFPPQTQSAQLQQQRPSSQSASSGGRSSLSSGIIANNNKSNRKFVPSDDEEEDDDDEEDEDTEDEDDDEQDKGHSETKNHKINVATKPTIITPPASNATTASSALMNASKKGKTASRIPQPSDDEESDQDDISDDSEDEDIDTKQDQEDDQMHARRMSTLRQLERGPSAHRRTRSTGDMMMLPPTESFVEPTTAAIAASADTTAEGNKLGSIEQWRMTVMEADGISTPTSSESIQSHATEDVSEEEEGDMVEEPIVRSITPSATANASNLPRAQTPMSANRNRRSTMGEMDMFYYQQQQQQQLYNMQLQQAMQMQQAQQMAQIQQYQAMQMHQQQQAQQYRKANNRKSVSAMDLLIQMEQEKAATRKTNKKKLPDPSKATLADGLLSRVPEQGQHSISFQHHVMKQQQQQQQQMTRASKSDYHVRQNGGGSSRPPSSMMMNNRRSQMIRSESSPIPTISMSTPINQGYLIPPNQQQQMLMPPQTQMMPLMNPSRSSQYLNSNNHRQSTYSNYNQF